MRLSGPGSDYTRWTLVAMVLCVAVCTYHFLAPMPDVRVATKKKAQEQIKLHEELRKFRDEVKAGRDATEKRLWAEDADQLGASVMGVVDTIANEMQVKVQAFRPQRTISTSGLTRYPYLVVLTGSFPKIATIMERIADPETKIAVTSVQISAADGVSDTVTASIGVSAFSETKKEQTIETK